MITFQQLRDKLTEAHEISNHREVEYLSTIVGELMANAKMVDGSKTVSDVDVLTHLKKHVKKLDETLAFRIKQANDSGDGTMGVLFPEQIEAEFFNQFLPQMMTETKLHKDGLASN